MGDYAVVARRSGANWYISVLNAGNEKDIEIDLASLVDINHCKAMLYYQPSEKGKGKIATKKYDKLQEKISFSVLKNSGSVLHIKD